MIRKALCAAALFALASGAHAATDYPTGYTKCAKEHGSLQKTIKPYVEFLAVTKEIDQAKVMLEGADADMKAFIDEEMKALLERETAPDLTAMITPPYAAK